MAFADCWLHVHVPMHLWVAGWLWDHKVSLGPQMSPGHAQLLIPSLCNDRPWGQLLALLLCTGSAQDELALSHIPDCNQTPKILPDGGRTCSHRECLQCPFCKGLTLLMLMAPDLVVRTRGQVISPGYRLGPFPFAPALLGACFKSRALCTSGGIAGLEKP